MNRKIRVRTIKTAETPKVDSIRIAIQRAVRDATTAEEAVHAIHRAGIEVTNATAFVVGGFRMRVRCKLPGGDTLYEFICPSRAQ